MSIWASKRVVLGVCGGIAAYKTPELVRALRGAGAEVRVVLTESAAQFVAPLALQVVSENRVGNSLFDPSYEHEIGHIELARWADLVMIAPATANTLARLRAGFADDLLSTVVLATEAPVLVCPAMNTQMWRHPATQENVMALSGRPRTRVVDPDVGVLACKEVGPGRLPDADVLLAEGARLLTSPRLVGHQALVTAGPTREAFDPARHLSNPSSGRMGFAVASSLWRLGADVTLVAGPSAQATPHGVRRVDVVTAAEMAAAVAGVAPSVAVMAAAVADWTPREVQPEKVAKQHGDWSPTLVRTDDILATIAARAARPRVVIGFAAESEDVIARAAAKRERKGADGIVANQIGGGLGFEASDNEVWLIGRGATIHVPRAPKEQVADRIAEWAASLLFGAAETA